MDDPSDSDERRLLEMIPKFIFLTACILILIFFAYYFIINNVESKNIEMEVFYNRLIYSTSAMAYYDKDLERSYLGRIDLEKLNSENLNAAINYTEDYFFASKIILQGYDPVYYHEDLWYQLEPLAKARIGGPGGADYLSREITVSFEENNTLKKGNMRIEIVRARS